MSRILRLVFYVIISSNSPVAAQIIELSNPSFEDTPADATTPQGWYICKEGSTPDILPGFWGVYDLPSDGETYIGLITRKNGSWENIGQRLNTPLKKNSCYDWYLDLAHSDTYSGYNGAIKLRIYISEMKCQKDQLIYESPFISHQEWKTYRVKFTPKHDCQYILLEAYYTDPPYSFQGNILIDHLKGIRICDRT